MRISIITAAYAPLATYLQETAASVAKLETPRGWSLEWLVQEDGTNPKLASQFATIPHVRYAANDAQAGISATRNAALSRAGGDLVYVLDHDDLLLPSAFLHLGKAFSDNRVGWAVGQADDLLPNGNRRTYESALPFGYIEAGEANSWALDHGANWPIHCAGLLLRADLVRAVGGWAGVPIDDDVIMFAGLSETYGGWNEPAITWLYRVHDRQTSKSEVWREHGSDGRRIAAQRVQSMRRIRGTASMHELNIGPAAKEGTEGAAWWKIS